jgi:hypothetical protein
LFLDIFASLVALSAITAPVAQERRVSTEYQNLVACSAVTPDLDRLACFDREAAHLRAAEQSGAVIIMPRARIEETRRALFGFAVPNLPDMMSGGPALETVETTLVSANQSDGWVFRLADGSVWRQVDTTALNFRPREGMPVRIRRAAVGSYMLKVGDSPAVRARRQ